MTTFAEFLHAKRVSKSKTSSQAAELIGVTSITYINWEEGKIEPVIYNEEQLQSICNFLEISIEELLAFFAPVRTLSYSWSLAHGNFLKEVFVSRGFCYKHNATFPSELLGISFSTFNRWVQNKTTPREKTLEKVLHALHIDPKSMLHLYTGSIGTQQNDFSICLKKALSLSKLNQREFAKKAGWNPATLSGYLQGRQYPSEEVTEKCGFSSLVTESKKEDELKKLEESLPFLSGTGLYLAKLRLFNRLSLQEAAEKADVFAHTITSLENREKKAYCKTLRKLAVAYKVDFSEFAYVFFGVYEKPSESFQERLKRLRLQKLLTIHEAAEMVGVHAFVYRRMEECLDNFPTHKSYRLQLIANTLGVSLDELLGFDKKNPEFGKWLHKARVSEKLSKKDLGLLLGADKKTVKSWENSLDFPPSFLIPDLAKIFGYTKKEIRQVLLTA